MVLGSLAVTPSRGSASLAGNLRADRARAIPHLKLIDCGVAPAMNGTASLPKLGLRLHSLMSNIWSRHEKHRCSNPRSRGSAASLIGCE
jgi:hypothetical protein